MPDDLVLCEPSGMTKVKRRFAIGNAFEAQVIEAYDKLWVRLVIPGAQAEPGIWSSKGAAEEAEWKHVVVGLHDRFKDVASGPRGMGTGSALVAGGLGLLGRRARSPQPVDRVGHPRPTSTIPEP